MTYRELLSRCKESPGCIGSLQQKKIDAEIRYLSRIEKMNREYEKKLAKKQPR